jgi:hypothetical protein
LDGEEYHHRRARVSTEDVVYENAGFDDSRRGAKRRREVKNPLDSIPGTIVAGLVLTAILYAVVRTWLV